jgi:hypothetical protein
MGGFFSDPFSSQTYNNYGAAGPPDPRVVNGLDSGTQSLLNIQQANARSQGPQDYANQTMQGVESTSRPISNDENANTNNSLGGNQADAGLGAAISAKAGKMYNKNLGAVSSQAQFQGALTNIQRSNDYATTQVGIANAQRGINSQMNEINIQAQAAQYQLVGSMFKGAGSIGGVMAANGAFSGSPASTALEQPQLGDSEFGGEPSYLGGDSMSESLGGGGNSAGTGYLGGDYNF